MKFLMVLLLLMAATEHAPPAGPQRTVAERTVTSDRDPAVRITVPENTTYVGSDNWILFGIANCQLFAFVEADAHKYVKRLYWIQFEGYIPTMPRLHHMYTSKEHTTMGGMDFYVDTFSGSSAPSKPDTHDLEAFLKSKGYAVPTGITSGSDEQHIDALITGKGYTLPPKLLSVRFVHTLEQARKELMIIYSEPNARRNASSKEKRALVQRAESALTIVPLR